MLEGASVRFSPNVFDAKYNAARVKLAQSALVPSRIFDDTAVWSTRPSPSTRELFVAGVLGTDGKYHLEARPSATPPTRAGDTRHSILLEQIASNQFRWDTRVDLAVGTVTADDFANAIEALLRAPEGRNERELRDDYRAAFPRAMSVFGKGFTIDSLGASAGGLGTTNVTMKLRFQPELMKPAYPALAGYLDKYLGPMKSHFAVADRSGAPLFDVVGRDRVMTIRYRLDHGKLVTLLGAPKSWPDTAVLTVDLSLKVKLFTVGFKKLATEFVISNTSSGNAHERAWTMIAQHEPDWDLPLITERLIRSPLRHPFEGQGAMFRLSVRDSTGAETVFGRRTRLDVQESAIMRFLGSLGSHAIGDLDGKVEDDEHRFLHDGLVALQSDLRALMGRPARDTH